MRTIHASLTLRALSTISSTIPQTADPHLLQTYKPEEIPPELYTLGALVFSLLGVTMQYKFCAWAGATFALAAFLNKRKHDSDSSQILSGVLFAVSGLAVVFMNGYHGEKARAFGSSKHFEGSVKVEL